MARVLGSLSPAAETQMESQAPGVSLDQSRGVNQQIKDIVSVPSLFHINKFFFKKTFH